MEKYANQSYSGSANVSNGSDNLSMSEHQCTEKCEKMMIKGNGQWFLEKRCWEGYKPVKGKAPYSKGSCEPVEKDDKPYEPSSPEDSAHGVVEEGSSLADEIKSLSSEDRGDMLRHLRSLKDKKNMRSEENRQAGKDTNKTEVAPEGSTNRETYLKAFGKSDVELSIYEDDSAEIMFGDDVPDSYIETITKTMTLNGYEEIIEKKEWSPKKEHKSEKGGLTEAGRKSYNRATGGNLKAPQPEGGPRKKSFCARNKGQIRMHNIDCKKDPDKRACKARRRWKCTN